MPRKPGTVIDIIRLLRNRRNIHAKITVELIGPEEECCSIIKEYASLRGDRPWWSDGTYAYGHSNVANRESLVTHWSVK